MVSKHWLNFLNHRSGLDDPLSVGCKLSEANLGAELGQRLGGMTGESPQTGSVGFRLEEAAKRRFQKGPQSGHLNNGGTKNKRAKQTETQSTKRGLTCCG